MESSEDDAGAASSASCGVSAREKNIGQNEDVDATRYIQPASTEARTSCRTPAMSEENFDGDSIPSPSEQHTSTEAILDMIDEIVDGPGAPKRVPSSEVELDALRENPATGTDETQESNDSKLHKETAIISCCESSPVASGSSESVIPYNQTDTTPSLDPSPIASVSGSSEAVSLHNQNTGVSSPDPSPIATVTGSIECVSLHNQNASDPSPIASVSGSSESVSLHSKTTVRSPEPSAISSVGGSGDCVSLLNTTAAVSSPEPSPITRVSGSSDSVSGIIDKVVNCADNSSNLESLEVNPVEEQIQDINKVVSENQECSNSDSVVEAETVSEQLITGIVCSSEQTLQNISKASECKNVERTINSVTLMDDRDSVTVERAESTSSDCSVSESKTFSEESVSRSPLKRRLVRPAPSERRPDSTVSSTVDSQLTIIHSTQQTSSEIVTKDVSSSSDAVPSVYGNVKPEEISNVSEISVCKAETSSAPKKIKLVRPKITPVMSISVKTPELQKANLEKVQCQSISSDEHSSLILPVKPSIESASSNTTTKTKNLVIANMPSSDMDDLESRPTESVQGANINKIEDVKHLDTIPIVESPAHSKCEVPISDMGSTIDTNLSLFNDCTDKILKKDNITKHEHYKDATPSTSLCSLTEKSNSNNQSDLEESSTHKIKSVQEVNSEVSKSLSKQGTVLYEEQSKEIDNLIDNSQNHRLILQIDKKVPPIKLNISGNKLSPSKMTNTESQTQIKDNVEGLNYEKNTDTCQDMSVELKYNTCDSDKTYLEQKEGSGEISSTKIELKKVPSIKLNLSLAQSDTKTVEPPNKSLNEESESVKQIPKLTIKLGNKQTDEAKSSVPKLTIKPLKPPTEDNTDTNMKITQQIPNVTKLNIKPIIKPTEDLNDTSMKSKVQQNDYVSIKDQIPNVAKLNIKPILKPPEKINIMHRKSSSSEISESEYSENDDTTSTSDQASTSEQGSLATVPKVTIKMGKPGTESEGQFYTEKNAPKFTIKNLEINDQDSMLKLIISQNSEDIQEKVPKLTIKTVLKPDNQPISPKLTIKPLKSPDNINKDTKSKILTESITSCSEIKENMHIPKITIKPIAKPDTDEALKTPKKATVMCGSSESIPIVTKLNIKPILKPVDGGESSGDKVPVLSKLNIKPVIKPKDSDIDSSLEHVPKVTKLNIKPLKNPEISSSEPKDCDEKNNAMEDSIPVVTKLNIKPVMKPIEEENLKDIDNQSSETGNSSDDNGDIIPVVKKINIKPLVKPEDTITPTSPKKDTFKGSGNAGIPVVTKLNIKPILKPDASSEKACDDMSQKINKNPPLLMKINMKNLSDNPTDNESLFNNVTETIESSKLSNTVQKIQIKEDVNVLKISDSKLVADSNRGSPSLLQISRPLLLNNPCNSLSEITDNTSASVMYSTVEQSLSKQETVEKKPEQDSCTKQSALVKCEASPSAIDSRINRRNPMHIYEENETNRLTEQINTNYSVAEAKHSAGSVRSKKSSLQNCTLLKQLLSSTKEDLKLGTHPGNCLPVEKSELSISNCKDEQVLGKHDTILDKANVETTSALHMKISTSADKCNDINHPVESLKARSIQEVERETSESVKKPLEISVTEKITNESSSQDSPRIILKINKTDHGSSAKIITEEIKSAGSSPHNYCENTVVTVNDIPSPKKHLVNSRRKIAMSDLQSNLTIGKRLRSSRIVDVTEKSPITKRNSKRPSGNETSPTKHIESDLNTLENKRLKLEQLLSGNKSLTITPVITKNVLNSPTKVSDLKAKETHNHSLMNSEKCTQKNGNSKLHNILSNLQAKQMQTLQLKDTPLLEKPVTLTPEVESATSTGSSDVVVEITRVENCHPEEMIINENSVCDLTGQDDVSQDPLEVQIPKTSLEEINETVSIKTIELTPQPRKRGRPRKLPVSEGPKQPITLPVPALEERPQRSLRLMRDKPAILSKPRGRGRGRGGRKSMATPPGKTPPPTSAPSPPPPQTEVETVIMVETAEERAPSPIDPTSSRIKLPRMTEALDKSVAGCVTPLSSLCRTPSSDLKLFGEATVVLESPSKGDEMKSPETGRPRRGPGSRGGKCGRTPRGRGRGRGGGRGAMYMKETLGIYGRVCGPATTTVQLFEEETCMMDDNATPSKPSHILDEDSQSSVKSSTNDSNKMKKSKFADLFDSNKVWTAADVKEYTWSIPDTPNAEPQVMMIQEQVAMFLGVKSFKRRYPELKRRTVVGEEREFVLSKGVVSEALCDLGITAVDASEVLDIMLSDYPHKYEEYRSYQRQKQLAESSEETVESKPEEKPVKVEVKAEKSMDKPEPPKVDPEKTRQDMALAAIASASEWNARANAWRRPACVDLQSMTIHRRRAPPSAPPPLRVCPPHGFYPHALLPGQYQHTYRVYTPDQLRYFPLNTALAAPPAAASESSSDSDGSWGERSDSSHESDIRLHSAKRKKLTKTKRSSQEKKEKEEPREAEVDLCRVCKLRLEANRKYTHERFLVCANCNAKLHPGCVELSADTIRKCREYPWQCAECKSCCACRRQKDDDKMLFCDLCDRGFHIYCVGLPQVPTGRWHCVECAYCKSCGARDPNGLPGAAGPPAPGAPGTPGSSSGSTNSGGPATPGGSAVAEWHHQTRRGPGGHKIYSHSLCTPCARAYRIGRYCPLCERSFIGPKGTMQLVICKLCDRQLHQECVRPTVSALKVLDYTCAECRRGGITSRAAAVRVAPRTIATLFMAKRRFNKYAHRQYLQSRRQAAQDPEGPEGPEGDGSEPSDPLHFPD